MGGPESWVTVERFLDPVAAQIARSRLEADGIECFLADEGMGGMYTYSLMVGVRLQVHPEDETRAKEILDETPPAPLPLREE